MTRTITWLCTLLLLISFRPANAQSTFYYKQTKVVRADGKVSTDVNGGQFVTFNNDKCYESDKSGYTVNNGYLTIQSTNAGITSYSGTSYWGKGTIFMFNSDKSVMNVVASNGDKYVYKRTEAPQNVETCTLIASAPAKTTTSQPGTSVSYPMNAPFSGTSYQPSLTSGTASKTAHTKEVHHQEKCWNCHGTGRVIKYLNVSTFGNDEKVWCPECQSWYFRSNSHTHVNCSYCHGTGYIDKVSYETVYE